MKDYFTEGSSGTEGPVLFYFIFFAYLSHLNDSDHQTNFNITQR